MGIENIIGKEDLKEPYDRLSDFLSIADIIQLEKEYGGQQIRFMKNYKDVVIDYPELAAILGKEKAVKVIKRLNGIWTYFPELKRSAVDKVKSLIIAEFNGYNYLQLAKKYGYTERHIRNIVAGRVNCSKTDERQISLFDTTL